MKKHFILTALLLTTQVISQAGAQESCPLKGYSLVWQDEFEGKELDLKKWTYQEAKAGWVNHELQTYIKGTTPKGEKTAVVSNGTLKINALAEGDKVYSARIYGNRQQGFRYGYIEARIKLPVGKGTWPAFWMMPVKHTKGWPADGEIDILEEVGVDANRVSSSIHCRAYNHPQKTQKTHEMLCETAESDFHVYALEWTKDYIRTYVDGKVQLFFENDKAGNRDTWPFDAAFYPILNLAWGGDWGGYKGVDPKALPVTMEVDYVRVWQKQPLLPYKPYLQNPTKDGITIMYQTSEPCHQWVEFGTDSTQMTRKRALLGGQEICHDIKGKVRLEGLTPGVTYYYRVGAQAFLKNDTYNKAFGPVEYTPCYSFTLPGEKTTDFRALVLNDLHLNYHKGTWERMSKLTQDWKYDFVIFNGDCITEPQNQQDAIWLINTLAGAFRGSTTPCFFVRGNHEIRGAFSSGMPELLDNPGGKTYGAFSWGDTRIVVLDCGEDKSDDHKEYFGLNDFTSFREEQIPFLKEELKSKAFKKAKARILVNHIPLWGNGDKYRPCTEMWNPLLKKAPFHVNISAHTHKYRIIPVGEAGNPYPVVIGGNPTNATPIILEKKGNKLTLEAYDESGKIVDTLEWKL